MKLKNNIDLKELQKTYVYKDNNEEEFKFKYDEDLNEYFIIIKDELISINANTKNIYLEYIGNGMIGNIIEEDILNILFDLIRADFLEVE